MTGAQGRVEWIEGLRFQSLWNILNSLPNGRVHRLPDGEESWWKYTVYGIQQVFKDNELDRYTSGLKKVYSWSEASTLLYKFQSWLEKEFYQTNFETLRIDII